MLRVGYNRHQHHHHHYHHYQQQQQHHVTDKELENLYSYVHPCLFCLMSLRTVIHATLMQSAVLQKLICSSSVAMADALLSLTRNSGHGVLNMMLCWQGIQM